MDLTRFHRGISVFNQGSFFEAHELLEDVWRESPDDQKLFYQGLVQIAVALHHYSNGNDMGAMSVMARAIQNLAPYPADFGGIELAALRTQLESWFAAVQKSQPNPPTPTIKIR